VNPRRRDRLAAEIRASVADLIASKLKDPRIGFVTVTRAEVAADLAYIRVFVSVLGDEAQRQATLQGLSKAAGFVRRELGQRLRLRLTPEVTFVYDRGIEAADRIARLIEETTEAPSDDASGDPEDGSDA
jgi:ribosome-binding factor A